MLTKYMISIMFQKLQSNRIRTIIGNAVSSVPKYLNGRVDGNQVSVFKGEIGGKGGSSQNMQLLNRFFF